jgi:hypothetical protein
MIYTPRIIGDPVFASISRAHPALLTCEVAEFLSSSEPGIAGDFQIPPQLVIACMYARDWSLDCSITSPGPTINKTGEILTSPVESWLDWLSSGLPINYDAFESEQGPPRKDSGLTILLNRTPVFEWSEGNWWPGINVHVSGVVSASEEVTPGAFASAGVGTFGASPNFDGAESGLTLTIAGVVLPFRYSTNNPPVDGGTISGFITLTPLNYLEVL